MKTTICLMMFALFAYAMGQTVKVEIHQGSSAWWLALSPSDSTTTGVAIKDSGSVTSWAPLSSTTWGYWTYQPSGVALVPPISVKLTKGSSVITANNLIPGPITQGAQYDTLSSFSGSPSTSAPTTQAPATQAPATKAPATPSPATQAPATHAPATPAPATQAPATPAPSSANAITVQVHGSSSAYWFAVSITGGASAASSVSLKDGGSYRAYTAMSSTTYGYFIFQGSNALSLPISLLATSASGSAELINVVTSYTQSTVNTGKQYGGGSSSPSTSAPTTQAPATQAPATHAPATQAPTTPAPATQAPATHAPATPAPATQAPATQAPATQAPATPAPTTKPATGATSAPAAGNPFAGVQFFINSQYTAEVDSSIAQYPTWAAKMSKVKSYPSSFWLDSMATVTKLTGLMNSAQQQQAASGKTVLVSLVVYDLPNRDCAAYASNGEISCNGDPACVSGLNTYRTQYIDVIYNILKNYPTLRIAAVVEPDSLPNLATNLNVPKCSASVTAYKTGVAYAISKLSQLSNVYLYVDAAHGGWLGWDTGRQAAVAVFAEVLTAAGGASKIRGFSTNVANYQPLGSMSYTADPCGLASQWNFGTCEVKYIDLLQKSLQAAGINGMHFITDTGRNGNTAARSDCTQWCNIKKAGLGIPPTTDTSASGRTDIDAYWWVKPPGEGDGTSDSAATRYDIHCGSAESMTPAPEAGAWFSAYFQMLCQYANPAL